MDVDDITDMLVEFEGAATGTLQASWLAGGFIIAVRDLLRSIAEGRPAEPDFVDGLRASEVVAAAQASAATRGWQAVERLDLAEA